MPARLRHVLVPAAIALVMSACAAAQPSSQAPRTSVAPSDVSATAAPSPSASVGQTDTDWGRIWDAVPAGFPRYPGSTPAEDASAAPSSARYTVSGIDPKEIAAWLQNGLETARFSTDVSGPFEDGSFTLDSQGDTGCRVNTTIAPLGGTTFVTVLYGASCPMR